MAPQETAVAGQGHACGQAAGRVGRGRARGGRGRSSSRHPEDRLDVQGGSQQQGGARRPCITCEEAVEGSPVREAEPGACVAVAAALVRFDRHIAARIHELQQASQELCKLLEDARGALSTAGPLVAASDPPPCKAGMEQSAQAGGSIKDAWRSAAARACLLLPEVPAPPPSLVDAEAAAAPPMCYELSTRGSMSHYAGVHFLSSKAHKPWRAVVRLPGKKSKYIGCFETKELAAAARWRYLRDLQSEGTGGGSSSSPGKTVGLNKKPACSPDFLPAPKAADVGCGDVSRSSPGSRGPANAGRATKQPAASPALAQELHAAEDVHSDRICSSSGPRRPPKAIRALTRPAASPAQVQELHAGKDPHSDGICGSPGPSRPPEAIRALKRPAASLALVQEPCAAVALCSDGIWSPHSLPASIRALKRPAASPALVQELDAAGAPHSDGICSRSGPDRPPKSVRVLKRPAASPALSQELDAAEDYRSDSICSSSSSSSVVRSGSPSSSSSTSSSSSINRHSGCSSSGSSSSSNSSPGEVAHMTQAVALTTPAQDISSEGQGCGKSSSPATVARVHKRPAAAPAFVQECNSKAVACGLSCNSSSPVKAPLVAKLPTLSPALAPALDVVVPKSEAAMAVTPHRLEGDPHHGEPGVQGKGTPLSTGAVAMLGLVVAADSAMSSASKRDARATVQA
mmetsp:Transcript_93387/g.290664  ORF Transcript_93387/g.290664 Transcript_93387/m.290664 type:complete len:688 (+) Transcript_93387:110-2173(+)